VTKLSSLWLPITAWVVALVVLVVVLELLNANSTVQGGALGAYCGAVIVVVMARRERATARAKAPVHPRYRS